MRSLSGFMLLRYKVSKHQIILNHSEGGVLQLIYFAGASVILMMFDNLEKTLLHFLTFLEKIDTTVMSVQYKAGVSSCLP